MESVREVLDLPGKIEGFPGTTGGAKQKVLKHQGLCAGVGAAGSYFADMLQL